MVSSRSLPLAVGQKIMAVIRGQGYELSIRGWRKDSFIIIDEPSYTGTDAVSYSGCDVSYIREGEKVEFKTMILTHSHAPTFLILDYPREFHISSLRKRERIHSHIPISYTDVDAALRYGTFRDITLQGALITHSHLLAKDSKIVINAELKLGVLDGLEAVVRNIRINASRKEDPCMTGVMFENISEKNLDTLQEIICFEQGVTKEKTIPV